ncbi:hypothetical protein B0H14DRAFT_2642525 [Mycena olivaceomarginata]|nr:hypothetical protein B0H14DRAFT_2642525 [Mycena olivaceomarginata]
MPEILICNRYSSEEDVEAQLATATGRRTTWIDKEGEEWQQRTHEQHLSLFFSFWSVKFEWSSLDGMHSVRQCYNSSCLALPDLHPYPTQLHTGTRDPIHPSTLLLLLHANVHHSYSLHPAGGTGAFIVLTNTHLTSFGKDNTVSVRQPQHPSPIYASTHSVMFLVSPHQYTSTPTPALTPTYTSTLAPSTLPGIPPMVQSVSSLSTPVHTSPVPGGNAKPKSDARGKRRSLVKGLFPFSFSSASAASMPYPIHVPRFRGWAGGGGEGDGEDDQDVWIDMGDNNKGEGEDDNGEDREMTVVDDWVHKQDEELLMPVPWCSKLLVPRTPPVLSVNAHISTLPEMGTDQLDVMSKFEHYSCTIDEASDVPPDMILRNIKVVMEYTKYDVVIHDVTVERAGNMNAKTIGAVPVFFVLHFRILHTPHVHLGAVYDTVSYTCSPHSFPLMAMDEGEHGGDEDREMTIVDGQEGEGDKELPIPVPWHSNLLGPHVLPVLSVNVHVGMPPTHYKSEGEGEEPQTLYWGCIQGRRP